MQFLLKNFWLVLVALLVLFRDSLFGLGGKNDGRSEMETPKSTSGAIITDTQAQSLAEDLYLAMNTAGWTDVEDIWRVFGKLKNEADWNKVYNKFGFRQYSTLFGNDGVPGIDGQRDLLVWLQSELSSSEWEQLTKDFRQLNLI